MIVGPTLYFTGMAGAPVALVATLHGIRDAETIELAPSEGNHEDHEERALVVRVDVGQGRAEGAPLADAAPSAVYTAPNKPLLLLGESGEAASPVPKLNLGGIAVG